MDSTPDGARMKVQRALNSLVKHLGGWKPYHDEDTQQEPVSEETSEATED